VTQIV